MSGSMEERRAARFLGVVAAFVMIGVPGLANAQGMALDAAATDATEQRRAGERESRMRARHERGPDVRLDSAGLRIAGRLPVSETPCVRIEQIDLLGDEAGRFGWVTDALAGPDADDSPLRKCLGTTGLDLVLQRAQEALRLRGYVTTRVLAQQQRIASGTLSLSVVPGRIHSVRFQNESGQRATLWNTFPAKPGDILNLHDIEQALENFRRVPTAHADIRIDSIEQAGPAMSDLIITHRQAFPFRFSLSADDSGTRSTGKRQGAITLSYDNWWTLSDLFYVTLHHDLGGGDAGHRATRGGTVHYSVPLGNWLVGGTLSRNRYAQTVSGASQDYVYGGTSRTTEFKVSRVVHRSAHSKTIASLKAFQRLSSNFIDDTEINVQRRAVGGWELGVSHRERAGPVVLEANVHYRRGTGAFGSQPAPEEAFGEGTSRFAVVTADVNLAAPFELGSQRMRFSTYWRGQAHRTPLTPQDRFAIGGRYSVRGFDGEASLVAERGWFVRNDLGWELGDSGQQAYLGLDYGQVGGPSAMQLTGRHLSGAVLGLRGNAGQLSYDLFLGRPVSRPGSFRTASKTAGFSLAASF